MDNKKPFAIIPNQGGVLSINNVVCRDLLIETYWKILIIRGIALFAERRFGKSSVIRKMANELPNAFIAIYRQVESIANVEDFVETLSNSAEENKLISKANMQNLRKIWNNLSEMLPEVLGVKTGKLNHHWQKKLILLIENILKDQKDKILVFFIDEFSLMIDKMPREEAVALIGFLREIVQDHFPKNLRFVYAGSVGIDLILTKIEKEGFNIGDPLNHLDKQELPTFTLEQSIFFCKCLELGCKIELDEETRNQLHNATDGIPFFIEKIFDKLKHKNRKNVEEVLEDILNDSKDQANLKYFYDRIYKYYPNPKLSEQILSLLSKTQEKTENEIIESILSMEETDEITIKNEIDRLFRDGYFERKIIGEQRVFAFKYQIIKSWWKINKA